MELNDLARQRAALGSRLEAAIATVLAHGRFILGPEVGQLEERLSAYTSSYAVTCANGTDALVLALLAVDIPAGSGVVVPSFTFCATAEAVVLAGAVPVFADVDRRSGLVTEDTLRRAVDAGRGAGLDVAAIVTVDLFGQVVEPGVAAVVAADAGLVVVSDAAQSFGAMFDGNVVGGLAPITTTSFFPSKPLGCYGDGGAVLVRDAELVPLLRSLRVHGQGADKYENVRIGMNSRLDTLQAAILLEKLALLHGELDARRTVAAHYTEVLDGVVEGLDVDPRCESAWAQFTVVAPERDRVRSVLADEGIPTAVYYPLPLHRQVAYAAYPRAEDLSASEWLAAHVVSLPMHPYLTADEVDRVGSAVRRAVVG